MGKWNSADWPGLHDGSGCPICLAGAPKDCIAELTVSRLSCPAMAPLRGYCCLVLKRHAVELYELRREEANAFMADIQRASQAIQRVTGAVKMNYEIHGNTIPHLHLHIFPRHVGDAFEGGPIDPRSVDGPPYEEGQHAALVVRIMSALSKG